MRHQALVGVYMEFGIRFIGNALRSKAVDIKIKSWVIYQFFFFNLTLANTVPCENW